MVKPHTSDIRMTYPYIRVRYGWHTSTYQWRTSTYEWDTDGMSAYEWHKDDIRVPTILGYLPKLKRGSGSSFWCTFSAFSHYVIRISFVCTLTMNLLLTAFWGGAAFVFPWMPISQIDPILKAFDITKINIVSLYEMDDFWGSGETPCQWNLSEFCFWMLLGENCSGLFLKGPKLDSSSKVWYWQPQH